MIRLITSLLLIGAIAGFAAFVAEKGGRLAVDWDGLRVETGAPVAIVLLLLALLLLFVLYVVLRWIFAAPNSLRRRSFERRQAEGYRQFSRGMIALAAGDARAAAAAATGVDKLLPQSRLSLLLTAQAAQLSGDDAAAHQRFTRMLEHKDTELLGLRGLLVQAQKAGQVDEVRRLALRAVSVRADAPWALLTLIEAEATARNWPGAQDAVERALKAHALPVSDGNGKLAAILIERARESEADPATARRFAESALKLSPGHPAAAVTLAAILRRLGKLRRARGVLQAAWSAAPHPDLTAAWAKEDVPKERRVSHMADLVGRVWSDDPAARLAMAEAALAAGDNVRARAELDALPEQGPTALVLRAELDRLQYGDHDGLRDLAARRVLAPPEPVWLCAACVTPTLLWHALCPACGRFDTLKWEKPRPVVLPSPPSILALAAPQ